MSLVQSFVALCTNTDQAKQSHLVQLSDALLFSEFTRLLRPFCLARL